MTAAAPALAQAQEHRLDNGLVVLTREVHRTPIASFFIWYRTGSRNELPGLTGISHWVEHMLFKGTTTFPKGTVDKLIARHGGVFNGATWLDWTHYYETLPSEHLRLALDIESDRMANSLFDPAEVALERGVVISEREGNENHHTFHLSEELTAAAFRAHSYGLPISGYKTDLRSMTRDDLWGYYHSHYGPNNAVVVAVGDFDTGTLLKMVEDTFGAIPRRPEAPEVRVVEPEQEGERRVTVRRPGPVAQLSVAFHAPAAAHPDWLPLFVLGTVLSAGRSARLYRALVVTGLASSAGAGLALTKDPYLFRLSATARAETEPPALEAAALAALAQVAEEGVAESELAKVRRQLRAGHVFSTEGVTSQARYLGQYEMAQGWRAFDTYLDDLMRVTTEDLVRVARTYLVEKNRTVGWFIPCDG